MSFVPSGWYLHHLDIQCPVSRCFDLTPEGHADWRDAVIATDERMSARTEIEITALHKSFGEHHVLRGIDLVIHEGDTVAIVGGSGCGKTVLLNLVLGKFRPDSGRIRVVDHDVTEKPLRDLADLGGFEVDEMHQHWGVVFQRNALFSGTVYENIALWLKEVKGLTDADIVPIARDSLEAVGLATDEEFLRTDTHELSGGMAKRLAVARALAMDPIVLFYDEPTTGLDPTNSTQMHDLIYATHNAIVAGGVERTTVIITHDKDLLTRLRPRTAMLHDGVVFFDGPFEDFSKSKSTIIRPYFDLMPVLNQRPFIEAG
jgi:phospholipid/cholesterol/gamma-HCH transport system ATP-binding protein